jgi:hypothetical protein
VDPRPANGKPSLQNADGFETVPAVENGWEELVGRFIGAFFLKITSRTSKIL